MSIDHSSVRICEMGYHLMGASLRQHADRLGAAALGHTRSIVLATLTCCSMASPSAWASCPIDGERVSLQQADDFIKNPLRLFRQGSAGLPRISSAVRQLLMGAPAARLDDLAPVFAKANPKQQEAIAKGIYLAVGTCERTNPSDSAAIRGKLRDLGDTRMQDAFERVATLTDSSTTALVAPSPTAAQRVRQDRDSRLLSLMPGMGQTGSLDLADPGVLPTE